MQSGCEPTGTSSKGSLVARRKGGRSLRSRGLRVVVRAFVWSRSVGNSINNSQECEMLTVEVCRRKAAEWLERVQSATDPQTRSGFERVVDGWTKLAEHVEQHPLTLRPLGSLAPQSSDPAGRQAIRSESGVEVADALRERLHLTGFDSDGALVEVDRSD